MNSLNNNALIYSDAITRRRQSKALSIFYNLWHGCCMGWVVVFDTQDRYLGFTEPIYILLTDIFYIHEKEGHPTRHVLLGGGVVNLCS